MLPFLETRIIQIHIDNVATAVARRQYAPQPHQQRASAFSLTKKKTKIINNEKKN